MDDFATMQMEMQVSIDSQTSMMHDLFDHFEINPDAQILQRLRVPRYESSLVSFHS
jgi:hypothetical protein